MNPSGDPDRQKALQDYFRSVSFDEQFHGWASADAGAFLTFNGKLALAGGAGAGLAATGELGALAAAAAGKSALSYTVGAGGASVRDSYVQGTTFAEGFNKHFSQKGLIGAAVVGGAGAAYLGQMFQWAGLPVSGAGWLTPAGAVLRANSTITGNVAGKATQAYLDSADH
jgi:filamentous hemagglutinin